MHLNTINFTRSWKRPFMKLKLRKPLMIAIWIVRIENFIRRCKFGCVILQPLRKNIYLQDVNLYLLIKVGTGQKSYNGRPSMHSNLVNGDAHIVLIKQNNSSDLNCNFTCPIFSGTKPYLCTYIDSSHLEICISAHSGS